MAERVIEWFVHAQRGKTKVSLPAPAGDDEAHAMASRLLGYGWEDVKVVGPQTRKPIPAEVPRKVSQVTHHHAGMTLREFQNVQIQP